ncbi:MAG: FixH family protein [Zoogloeaceae bacterium]|nr:FixH family protein [Zoogloeaceae bacterium]
MSQYAHPVKPVPWYRQGWPWFLIAFPGAAVVAGGVTLWLAITTSDGLVVDDYYKQGLAIERTIARSKRATELGLVAQLRVRAGGVEVYLTGKSAIPTKIRLSFAHPTRVGLDQVMELEGSGGRFGGTLPVLVTGRWDVQIEDLAKEWRLNGHLNVPSDTEVRMVAGARDRVE